MAPGGYRKPEDLPQVIPVFPLDMALLLPGGALPLNIFEPRYLNMIDDAMAGERLIGMVQTKPGGDRARPNLANVGCAGRITSFAETSDGRYLIVLTGVCRFDTGAELAAMTPYRQTRADFRRFAADLDDPPDLDFDRPRLLGALKRYLDSRGVEIDWAAAEEAPAEALVTRLSMGLPFDVAEKQALLEAEDGRMRLRILTALLEIDAGLDDDAPPSMQ